MRDRLRAVVAAVQAQAPALRLTLDPLEFRGFRYHTGVCLTVFSQGRAEELGRGGRYRSGPETATEAATGLSLFPAAVLRVCPPLPKRSRAYVPWGTPPATARRLRAEGFATIAALAPDADPAREAARLRCTHLLHDPLGPSLLGDDGGADGSQGARACRTSA